MRFNEKLQFLRKEKKLSQEQLADMLDVTRQSVSKWESGTTYPEMDKLIMLCRIFKCSLDDLTNDEISEIEVDKKANSNSFNNILDSFFGFIGKTVKMFQTMSFKQIVKCIFSMFMLALFLMIFYIPFQMLDDGFSSLIYNVSSNGAVILLRGTFSFILNIIFFAIYFMMLVYIFKIAYLDKYEFVESGKKEENLENHSTMQDEKEEIKEVKILAPNPEPRDSVLFKVLGGIVLVFIKFLLACFSLPIIFFLVALCFLLAIDVYLIIDGLVFIGIFLALVFAIVLCAWFLEAISIFLFNRKIPFKRLLITFIIGLFGLGVSLGICLLEIYNIDYIDEIPVTEDFKMDTKKEVVPMNEKIALSDFSMYDYNVYVQFEYVEDETMDSEVSFELSYYPEFVNCDFDIENDIVRIHRYYADDFNSKKRLFKLVKKNLENRKIYNYDAFNFRKMIVRTSSENIKTIKNNTESLNREERDRYYNSVYQCEAEIESYENRISRYEDTIEDLNDQNEVLQDRIEELEEYKSKVQGALSE